MELSVSLEELCRIVLRLREYEAQVPAVDPDDGSNPTDDKDVSVLEDESNEPVEQELIAAIGDLAEDEARSEEHTSEIQSLMRISYAVLCLKKKNTIKTE